MAVHIRHGAPGSFKTAAAVWFDILAWLREGRVVYTNIRGMLDVADIELELKETFPATAELVCVDTDSHEARMAFAGWFHWLPIGAAICIDEAQFIYPTRKDFKPESLDYPGGLDAATEAGRPADIFTAIDKHRHYNWDVCCTTPNIKKLPEWLRGVVEAAYHHKNMEHIPVYGKRKARIHKHDASTTGTSLNKQSQYELKRIPVTVHALYGSTVTGTVTTNRAEQNPFKNPRLLGFLGLSAFATIACIWLIMGLVSDDQTGNELDIAEGSSAPFGASAVRQSDEVGSGVVGLESELVPGADVVNASGWDAFEVQLPGLEGVSVAGWFIVDNVTVYLYRVITETASFVVPAQWMKNAGFELSVVNNCAHDLSHPSVSFSLRVLCSPISDKERGTSATRSGGGGMSTLSSVMPLGLGG